MVSFLCVASDDRMSSLSDDEDNSQPEDPSSPGASSLTKSIDVGVTLDTTPQARCGLALLFFPEDDVEENDADLDDCSSGS